MAPHKQWKDEDMQKAYDAVIIEKLSISAAAKQFNVPRTTLGDRVNGKVPVDVQMGRPVVLGSETEETLVKYISYAAEQRYPITRRQVIGLAWAISLERGQDCFNSHGPSLKWWRGFKKRHPEVALRKQETVDKGRVSNATPEIINDYFNTLQHIIDDKGLKGKPSQIYNSDEAAIFLNRSSEKVLVPVKQKHAHSLAQGTNSHISVLCCVNAAGDYIPPLQVFSKGLPAGRSYKDEGPPGATYATSESGFVDREIYSEWFEKNFLEHATKERPLLLLQDGASAHISPKLIETAIANDVILLCFPPKLTHILQPCDVAIYRKMKAELSQVMQQVKMLRGDYWISKQKFPAVFKEVMERTFKPEIIKNSFRKCGIYPLNKDAVSKDLIQSNTEVSSPAASKKCTSDIDELDETTVSQDGEGPVSAVSKDPIQLDTENVSAAVSKRPTPDTEDATVSEDGHPESAVSKDLIQSDSENVSPPAVSKKSTSEIDQCHDTTMSDDDGSPVIALDVMELNVESVDLDPSEFPTDSQILLTAEENGGPTACPPALALHALESALTPQRKKTYLKKFAMKGAAQSQDPVYQTWANLKKQVDEEPEAKLQTNPLVKSGLIPADLTSVLTPIAKPQKHPMFIGKRRTCRARVLTAEEVANEILAYEKEKQEEQEAKVKRKEERERKKEENAKLKKEKEDARKEKQKESERKRQIQAKMMEERKRKRKFEGWQKSLKKCKTFASFQEHCQEISETNSFEFELCTPDPKGMTIDAVSQHLLCGMENYSDLYSDVQPITIPAYGDCLPCTASCYMFGSSDHELEVRVRIAVELAVNKDVYLDNNFLEKGIGKCSSRTRTYAMFCDHYQVGSKLSDSDVHRIFEAETMATIKSGSYMGMWQVHAVSSILGAKVKSVYPGLGPVAKDLHRLVYPREAKESRTVHIMWTHTANSETSTWWEPNHFVPLLPTNHLPIEHMNITEMDDKTEGEMEAEEPRELETEDACEMGTEEDAREAETDDACETGTEEDAREMETEDACEAETEDARKTETEDACETGTEEEAREMETEDVCETKTEDACETETEYTCEKEVDVETYPVNIVQNISTPRKSNNQRYVNFMHVHDLTQNHNHFTINKPN